LADIELENGEMITAHCPTRQNAELQRTGTRVMISKTISASQIGLYLELYCAPDSWVNVNTLRANAIVAEALRAESIPELAGIHPSKLNKKRDSRIDFLLHGQGGKCLSRSKASPWSSIGLPCFPTR
jgi:sugar fermentation stimulation protein A